MGPTTRTAGGLAAAVAATAAAAGLGVAWRRHGERRDATEHRRPGHFARLGGEPVHVVLDGAGDPAIVLVSGLGGSHLEWEQVAAGLRDTARVVRHDRPGFAFTPFAATDRRPGAVARMLRELLTAEGIPPPYVLVGHSLGGIHVRAYAALFPREVAGAVLIDPTHEDVLTGAGADVLCRAAGVGLHLAAALGRFGAVRLFGRMITAVDAARLADPHARHSAAFLAAAGALTHRTVDGWRGLAAEYGVLARAHAEVAELTRERGFPAVPLTVISAGRRSSNPLERLVWSALRADTHPRTTTLSPFGRHVVAEHSGHLVPLDEPRTVIDEVRAVHRRCRRG